MPDTNESKRSRVAATLRELANQAEVIGGRVLHAVASRADSGAAGDLLRRVQEATGKMATEGTLSVPKPVRHAMGQVSAIIRQFDHDVQRAEAEASGVGQPAEVRRAAEPTARRARRRHKKQSADTTTV